MADPEHIYHWFRLDERVTTSGQPSVAQLADLAKLGVWHIIDLAPHNHETALPDEAGTVERLGMSYINIPVDFKTPSHEHFEEFCRLMREYEDVPVHVHCGANYRVAAFIYRYRRDVLGFDDVEARSDLEKVWHPNPAWAAFISR